MTPKFIPLLSDVPAQVFTIVLNDISYIMRAKWNTRSEFWTLDISDENDVIIIRDIALKSGIDLLAPFNFEIGSVYVANISGGSAEMTLSNVGTDTALVYLEPEEDV